MAREQHVEILGKPVLCITIYENGDCIVETKEKKTSGKIKQPVAVMASVLLLALGQIG